MILLNFLLNLFYAYLHRYGQQGLLAAIFLLTIPLCLNIVSLLILLVHLLVPEAFRTMSPIIFGIGIILLAILIDRFLKRVYLRKDVSFKASGYKLFYYVTGPVYYILSIILFFLSLKYLFVV